MAFNSEQNPYSIVNNTMPQSEHEYATVVHDWLIDTCFTTCSKDVMPIQNDNNARKVDGKDIPTTIENEVMANTIINFGLKQAISNPLKKFYKIYHRERVSLFKQTAFALSFLYWPDVATYLFIS